MKIEIRLPGTADYSYASVTTTEGSPFDNMRELRDVSDELLNLVTGVLQRGCAFASLAPLNPRVIQDSNPGPESPAPAESPWESPAQDAPAWAAGPHQDPRAAWQAQQAPQAQPQQWQQPQAQQAPAWQQSQQGYGQQPQQPTPPGVQSVPCAMHGQPTGYKDGGFSTRTNKPYPAFRTCPQSVKDCTTATNKQHPIS